MAGSLVESLNPVYRTKQTFPTPSFGDENFNLEDSLKPNSLTPNTTRTCSRDPSEKLAADGEAPISISCTTQVALVQPYNPAEPYGNSSSVAYSTGPSFIPNPANHHLSPDHLPLQGRPYPEGNATGGGRLICNIDTEINPIRQQYPSNSSYTADPGRPYTHYSPQPGAVPYSNSNASSSQYSCVPNPHLQTPDQYYQQQVPSQACCPPQLVYHAGPPPSHYTTSTYNTNPQFPPQNFVDIPDITENNSVYYQYYNHGGVGYTPRTSYIPMAQREPILSTMDEAVGRQAGGVGMTGSPGNNTDDSDDNLPLTKITRGKVSKRKRGGRGGGGRGGTDASSTGKPEKKTKTPKKRRKKDPNEPVKPVSAYAMFFRDTQAAIKSQSPKATFGDVSKIVASMWDGLDEQAKSDYKVKTEIAKKEYLQKLAAYRASLLSQGADGIGSGEGPSPEVSPERNIPSTSVEHNPVPPTQPTFQDKIKPAGYGETIDTENYSKPEDSTQSQVLVPPTLPSIAHREDPENIPEQAVQKEGSDQTEENGVQEEDVTEQESEMKEPEATSEPTQNGEDTRGDSSENSNSSSHTEEQSVINTNVFYGKSDPPCGSVCVNGCTRVGCDKEAVDSPMWDSEYCSNQCVVEHCRDVFTAWVASRSGFASVN